MTAENAVEGRQPANPAAADSPAVTKAVLEYLRARGYRRAEAALREEKGGDCADEKSSVEDIALQDADVDDDLRNVIMMLRNPTQSAAELDARRFEDSYCELRDWIDGSLDLYKSELHSVLYPLLVHSFLEIVRRGFPENARAFLTRCASEFSDNVCASLAPGRREEITSLAGVSTKQHMDENEIAQLFLNNRYELHLSWYAFELVVSFLSDDPRRAVLLRILNQHCRVRLDADADYATRSGSRASEKNETATDGFISAKERSMCVQEHDVLWGRLTAEHYIIPDEEELPSSSANNSGGGGGAGDAHGGKLGSGDAGKAGKSTSDAPGAAGKRPGNAVKGDKSVVDGKGGTGDGGAGAGGEDGSDSLPHVRPDGTLSESRIPLKRYRLGALGLDTEEDIRCRARFCIQTPEAKEGGDNPDGGRADIDVPSDLLPSVLCYSFTNTRGDGLNCSAVSADGSQVAAGFGDSTVRLWDGKAVGTAGDGAGGFGNQAVRLVGHSGPVYSVDWTMCARFVLSGSEDGTVRLWSSAAKTDLVAYRGHNYPVWSVGMSPLDHYFASGSHDRTARLWSTDRVFPLRILAGHLADVDVVRWHPNCNYIATGSSDRTARLWDLRDGRCVRVFGSQSGAVQSLAFSPDGRSLAISGDARAIDIWDIAEGRQVTSLQGHGRTVWSMDFSKDGAILASGGADNTVRLWKAGDWSLPGVEGAARGGGTAKSSGTQGVEKDGKKAGAGNGEAVREVLGKRRVREGGGGAAGDAEAPLHGLVATLRTRQTPIHMVSFTRRNLLIAAGSYQS